MKTAAQRSGKTMGFPLMLQFMEDNIEELLPIAIKDGVTMFSRRFCELHQTQRGRTPGPALFPDYVAESFKDHFQDHLKFYNDHVLPAYESLGGKNGGIKEEDIETFYDLVKTSIEGTQLHKSTKMNRRQRIVICRMVLPTNEASLADDSEFRSDMFEEDVVVENTASVDEKKKSPRGSGKDTISVLTSKDPNKTKAHTIIKSLCEAAAESGSPAPTNPQVREAVAKQFPELEEWVTIHENMKWISNYLNRGVNTLNLSTTLNQRGSTPKPPKQTRKRGSRETKSDQHSEALDVIHEFQGKLWYKKPQFYSVDEMIEKVSATKPHLSDWAKDPENRDWFRGTLSRMKTRALKNSDAPVKPAKEPKVPKVEQIVAPKPPEVVVKEVAQSPAETVPSKDFVERTKALIDGMKSGTIPPIEVLKEGEPLLEEFTAYINMMDGHRGDLRDGLERYRKLFADNV